MFWPFHHSNEVVSFFAVSMAILVAGFLSKLKI